jgi:hypothetical protein
MTNDLKQKIDSIILEIEKKILPAPKEDIIKACDILAKLFSCELPAGQGLDVLVRALEEIPSPLFKMSCSEVTRTWKYLKFPPPATFLEAIQYDTNSGTRYLISLKEVSHRLS